MAQNQRAQLESLTRTLDTFTEFLRPFRLLVNTHNVQFVVDNLWQNDSYINAALRTDLEAYIAECGRNETPVNLVKYFMSMRDKQTSESKSYTPSLDALLGELIKFDTLWHQQVLTRPDVLIQNVQDTSLNEFNETVNRKFEVMVKQNRFMNAKKAYEVDEMSMFVARLCQKLDVHTVT
jgi:hypothetical protein